MSKREKAYEDYISGMKLCDIADKHRVKPATVRSWKARYWDDIKTEKEKKEETATLQRKKRKRGGQEKNHNALKHGLYAKYLPTETFEIVNSLDDISPLDILWSNIQIKYASILRAQRIMYVENANDNIKYETITQDAVKNSDGVIEQARISKRETIITALEREEKFIAAQSRAMDTLTRMIKQYEEMLGDELGQEERKVRIDKMKLEISAMSGTADDDSHDNVKSYVEALTGVVEEVWDDEETQDE